MLRTESEVERRLHVGTVATTSLLIELSALTSIGVLIYIYYRSHPRLQRYSIITIRMPIKPNAGVRALTTAQMW